MKPDAQFKLDFNPENPLRQAFSEGRFAFILEVDPPCPGLGSAEQQSALDGLATWSATQPDIAAFFVTERLFDENSRCTPHLLGRLRQLHGKSPIATISGRDLDPSRLPETLGSYASEGVKNFFACSGHWLAQGRLHVDGVETLRSGKSLALPLFCGAAVNPFKYSVNDVYGQYLKMILKINAGADFIVTQAGWDMRKYHELARFCSLREVSVPIVARLALIGETEVPRIAAGGLVPGAHVSQGFAAQLQRELQSRPQFMSVQLKRLSLQAAGCALMGYSAVQIRGLRNAAEAATVLDTCRKVRAQFSSFGAWLEAWKDFHHGISMTPANHHFYIYRQAERRRDEPENAEPEFAMVEADFDYPPSGLLWRNRFARLLKVEHIPGRKGQWLRQFLCGGEQRTDLRLTQYVCLESCPKKLVHGPCGGSRLDGSCEVEAELPCIHNTRLGVAAWNNQLDLLEQAIKAPSVSES